MKSNKSKHQKFVMATVQRSELKSSEYNPRQITDEARRRLKRSIRVNGLVEPVVWNKRTGNVVGGHQRLKILDEMSGGRTDYELDVAQIDCDEKAEKKLNVMLNNPATQGDYDPKALERLILDIGKDFEDTGFDLVELQTFCDSAAISGMFASERDTAGEIIDDLAGIKGRREKAIRLNSEKDSTDFYATFVFRDAATLTKFLAGAGLDTGTRIHDGAGLARRMGVSLD